MHYAGWMVEQIFRTAKSLLDTRPSSTRPMVRTCLLLVPRAGVARRAVRRIDNAGVIAEWDDILRDLNALTETRLPTMARPSRCAATPSASPARLHNASGSGCPTPYARSTLRRRSLTRVPEHRRLESRRTLACSAKAFPVPYNPLTYNAFYFSTVEDESKTPSTPPTGPTPPRPRRSSRSIAICCAMSLMGSTPSSGRCSICARSLRATSESHRCWATSVAIATACATPMPRPGDCPSAPASWRRRARPWSPNGSNAPACDGGRVADKPF